MERRDRGEDHPRGRVVDPGTGTDAVLDLLIEGERVTALAARIAPPSARR
ncbi:hypothetical protein ACFQY7_31035 [Actinomadura luteofluorescens]